MLPGTSMRAIGALLVLGALVAWARPPASRVPASAELAADEPTPTGDAVHDPAADEPAAPGDPAPPAADLAASVGDERRPAATDPRVFIEPPSPASAHNDADVWGGDGAAEFGRGGLGCPRSAR